MKSVGLKFFILFSTMVLSLVLGEYTLRIVHPITPEYLRKAPYSFSCYEQGLYYWLRYQRNTTCKLTSNIGAFANVFFDLNNLGLRNPEIQMPKPLQRSRILFVGDSFIAGWGVPVQSSLPHLSGEILRKLRPTADIETINAGLSASGQGYSYLFLKHQGMVMDPDIIVVGLYIQNDISDSLRESEWINIDSSGLPESIGSSNSYVDIQGNVRRNSGSLKLKIPWLRTSYLYDLITDGILKLYPEKFAIEGQIDLSCVYDARCHTYDSQKQKMMKLFSGIHELVTSAGKKMIVILIPSELQVHPEHSNRYGILKSLSQLDVQRPHDEFAQYFRKHGIQYLDLLPTFQKYKSDNLYFLLDEHWTKTGNELAAKVISEYINDLLADR